MRTGTCVLGLGWLLWAACGCGGEVGGGEEPIGSHASKVVYGADDRRDVYEVQGTLHARATESSIALIAYGFLRSAEGGVRVEGTPLGDAENLCSDQRFRDQPVAATCSGTLVAEDLVLTAGHCATSFEACSNLAIVFNYRMDDARTVHTVSDEDVYSCVEIVARAVPDSSSLDFAFLRLDRPVARHLRPAPIRMPSGHVERGSGIAMIGHPSGLPAKVTDGAIVRDESIRSGNLFLTNLDAFAGNSGSGVYDEEGSLIGVLVWGERDYQTRDGASCSEVNVLPSGDGSEGVVYAFRALERLCEASPFVSSVCDTFCAEGGCTGEQTIDDFCGEGGCLAPPEWRCDPAAYGTGGSCDCECGAIDPDCTLPSRPVAGCQGDMICGEDGRCVDARAKSHGGIFQGCQAGGAGAPGAAGALMLTLLLVDWRRRRRAPHPEM